MMDYEELYQQIQPVERELSEKLAQATKTFRSMAKNAEKGDLKGLMKDLAQMNQFVRAYEDLIARYTGLAEGFDVSAYMAGGDFAKQIKEACEQLSVDIQGDFPIYEIFPYKVRIDSENQELGINRRKMQCARPQYFVKSIKKEQDRMRQASFNVNAFLNELARAYDTAIAIKDAQSGGLSKKGQAVSLKDLYAYMVPMQRSRRDYDMQNYAYDLARLYSSDVQKTKDGREFQFDSGRTSGKLIRILDQEGREHFLSGIRFYDC